MFQVKHFCIVEMTSNEFDGVADNFGTAGAYPAFNWSPLPQKRYFTNKHDNGTNFEEKETLFPGCDNNLWLRSCEEEILEPLEGTITGEIPSWLGGTLIRNGPGSLKVGKYSYDHLFDSAALLHRFHIENGNVTYQCRFLQSDVYKRNMKAQRIVYTEFGTKAVPDPCQTIFDKVSSIFNTKDESDNAMISVYPFDDELYAFAETPIMHKVNPQNLRTEKKIELSKYLTVVNHTSHPHVMEDGTVYNLALSIGITGPVHCIVRFPCNDKTYEGTCFDRASIIASVPAKWPMNPSYMHTFGVTENYFIIVEQPLSVSIVDIAKCKLKNEPLIGALKWFYEEKTKINILSRKTGKLVSEFYADSFFYLHLINQYEKDEYVIVDICAYRDPTMLECMYIDAMKNLHQNPDYAKMFKGRPIRFVLPMNIDKRTKKNENLIRLQNTSGKAYLTKNRKVFVEPERLCNLGCETPRINYEKHLGKDYRYFYAISADVDAENPGSLIKVDVKYKTVLTWYEHNCFPSEPIFVPSPESKEEDDGILLSALLWGGEDTNHVGLLILDARTMKEIGRAEFSTNGPIPKCLHGWFLEDKNTKL